jgi:hypothetical protein
MSFSFDAGNCGGNSWCVACPAGVFADFQDEMQRKLELLAKPSVLSVCERRCSYPAVQQPGCWHAVSATRVASWDADTDVLLA